MVPGATFRQQEQAGGLPPSLTGLMVVGKIRSGETMLFATGRYEASSVDRTARALPEKTSTVRRSTRCRRLPCNRHAGGKVPRPHNVYWVWRTTSTEQFAYRTTWPALEPRK
jgi:hypothetical protein